MDVKNKRVLVVGLARSGFTIAHALARRGAIVTVTDRKPPAEFPDLLPPLLKQKVGLELGSQRMETFLRNDVIIISPGVPWDLPQLQAARDRGIPVYPEIEAASWFLRGTIVGITGSNGKTTTTALLGDMLQASGFQTFVGGNIGNALSSAVDQAPAGTRFVTELSSFQLEGIHDFRPHVAVMLNLSPNHLDRHPSLEAYAQAKRQIFRNQQEQDYAVLNADDPWVAGLQSTVSSQPMLFSRQHELPNGVFLSKGRIYYRVRHLERVLFDASDVKLRGDFNLEDVLAAAAAACVLGADFAAIRRAVRAFKAVEHRLEYVREIQGVDFFNNSKATSVDATLKSLEAFERGVHLIMGGKDKGAPYAPLIPLIKERVREVLLIGAAAPVIAKQLAGVTELVQAGDLATAVYEAFNRARPGDTVLLAPACSSFDQFTDYEERGRVFKELVQRLAAEVKSRKGTRSGIRNGEAGLQGPVSGIRNREAGVRGPGSGIRNGRSEIAGPPRQEPKSNAGITREESPPNAAPAGQESRPTAEITRPESQPSAGTPSSEPQPTAGTAQPGLEPSPKPGPPAVPHPSDSSIAGRGSESTASTAEPLDSAPGEGGSSAPAPQPERPGSDTAQRPEPPQAEVPSAMLGGSVYEEPSGGAPAQPAETPKPDAVQGSEGPADNSFRLGPDGTESGGSGSTAAAQSAEKPQAGTTQDSPIAAADIFSPAPGGTEPFEGGASESAQRSGESETDSSSAVPDRSEGDEGSASAAAQRPGESEAGSSGIVHHLSEPDKGGSFAAAVQGASPSSQALALARVDRGRRAPANRVELTYVYEVDAAEMPGMESQLVSEDEPSISISTSAEVLEDDVLPYEARPPRKSEVKSSHPETRVASSEVRSPKSEEHQTLPEAPG
jgi:UDP-N-acetylmuramoylalanine--D-glutamate ligase